MCPCVVVLYIIFFLNHHTGSSGKDSGEFAESSPGDATADQPAGEHGPADEAAGRCHAAVFSGNKHHIWPPADEGHGGSNLKILICG